MQAAILIEKLAIFPDELEAREAVAARYSAALGSAVKVPKVAEGASSAWAQYTLTIPHGRRDAVAAKLKADGVPTNVYYPRPVPDQPAYKHYPIATGGLPVSSRLPGEVLSLPMHPYLSHAQQDHVIAAVLKALMD